jgi:hypothetical protein
MSQTTTPAPASGGGSPASWLLGACRYEYTGSLISIPLVSIQPSDRWTCEMRNTSIGG